MTQAGIRGVDGSCRSGVVLMTLGLEMYKEGGGAVGSRAEREARRVQSSRDGRFEPIQGDSQILVGCEAGQLAGMLRSVRRHEHQP